MKKTKTLLKMAILFSLTLSSGVLFSADEGQTTKAIWLEFSGKSNCEVKFCADGIPANLLDKTLSFYKKNLNIITNNKYLTIIDFNRPSTEKRMYILNIVTGSVQKLLVTHGKKTESLTTPGIAQNFSNEIGSEMSSLGFYSTDDEEYIGKHGVSLRLNGLSKSNSNARERNIVLHSADYATQWFADEKGRLGLSQGCPAISPDKIKQVIEKLKSRSLIYISSETIE
jgi:hypothetical protein